MSIITKKISRDYTESLKQKFDFISKTFSWQFIFKIVVFYEKLWIHFETIFRDINTYFTIDGWEPVQKNLFQRKMIRKLYETNVKNILIINLRSSDNWTLTLVPRELTIFLPLVTFFFLFFLLLFFFFLRATPRYSRHVRNIHREKLTLINFFYI